MTTEDLKFRRFDDNKQEQIRQLVGYCTLMGLTGKDLISIGNKLERIKKANEMEQNLAIGLSYQIKLVEPTKKHRHHDFEWTYTDAAGTNWRFDIISRLYRGGHSVRLSKGKNRNGRVFYAHNEVKNAHKNIRANIMYICHKEDWFSKC
jgi:hypothetical protein